MGALLTAAERHRVVANQALNATSSRSHALLTIHVIRKAAPLESRGAGTSAGGSLPPPPAAAAAAADAAGSSDHGVDASPAFLDLDFLNLDSDVVPTRSKLVMVDLVRQCTFYP